MSFKGNTNMIKAQNLRIGTRQAKGNNAHLSMP